MQLPALDPKEYFPQFSPPNSSHPVLPFTAVDVDQCLQTTSQLTDVPLSMLCTLPSPSFASDGRNFKLN
jgi:hypothetical protein